MQWSEVINDERLKNLPYKIELNEYGQLVMSSMPERYSFLQAEIAAFLGTNRRGKVLIGCAIATPTGVKVADAVWAGKAFLQRYGLAPPYPQAPEICVEIVSSSTSNAAMQDKINVYLSNGAKEVWLYNENGTAEIYTQDGKVSRSAFFHRLPVQFEF
ncbi:MAG: Uma2 family endonuclease [Gammaproteobacteria bacterium]